MENQEIPPQPAPAPPEAPETEAVDSPEPQEPSQLGTFELLRAPDADKPSSEPDDDVTASVLCRPRRSVWD